MYEQYFGLSDEPFRLTPDPRYLFLSAKHAEALAHLRLGLTESSGFVCITGDVGTGKTTLLRAFLGELGPRVTAAYALTPPLSALELLRRICREFGLPVGDETGAELLERIHAYLMAQSDAGRTTVLVLDEAQALSIELLEQVRLLLNLETETRKLLRIVLVGQPQLRKLLLDPDLAQLNQRITLRWHLGPLSRRETAAYVRHRLAVASDGKAERVFTRPALRLLHSVSGGIPRLINMLGHRALLAAFVARERQVTRRFVARAYREIQTVPLPGTLTVGRRAALAGTGLTIGAALVAVGLPILEHLLPPPSAAVASAPGGEEAAPPPPVAVTAPPAPAPAPAPVPAAAEAIFSSPPSLTQDEVAQRLAGGDLAASARAATAALLAAWGERPLADGETRLPDDLEAVAWRRGLHQLQLTGNQSMLRLLDLPALLILRLPGTGEPRYAALTGLDGSRALLAVDGAVVAVAPDTLAALWTGQAHVLWRDFAGLGPSLHPGERGLAVAQLQALLRRAGASNVEPNGTFDAATARAVVEFQQRHLLEPDGIVGPLTRIVLYGAEADRRGPGLVSGAGGRS